MAKDTISYEDAFELASTPAAPSTGGISYEEAFGLPSATPKSRSLASFANDTVIETANAAAGGLASAANFIKPGNAVSGWIDKNIIKAGEAKQSDVVKASKQQFQQEVADADGVVGELGAVGRFVVNNPLLAAAQAAGSFVVPGAAIKAGRALAGIAGVSAKAGGLTGAVASNAAMAGGDAAGTAYELSNKAGATEDQAVAAGRQASVLPAVVGGLGGLVGAERLVAGAKGFGGNAASKALKTAGVEGAQEAFEEGLTQYEGQRAAMPYDASIDPSKGVAAAAGMGAALGGMTGGGVSLLTSRVEATRERNKSQAPAQEPTADATPEAAPLMLGNSAPDQLIAFPDGSVGRVGEVESYIASLPEDQQAEARARFMGRSYKEVNDPAAQQARRWWENYAEGQPVQASPDYLAEVQQAVRSGTQFSDQQTVDTVRDAMEDAWLTQNVAAQDGAPMAGQALASAQAVGDQLQEAFDAVGQVQATAAVDARVRTNRILQGLQNILDGGTPNSVQAFNQLNQGLINIDEAPLSPDEMGRVRRMLDAYMGFKGVGQPAPLPSAPQTAVPAIDRYADNAALESQIRQRPSQQMGIDPQAGALSRLAAQAVDSAPAAPTALPTTGASFEPQANQAQQAIAQQPQAPVATPQPAAGLTYGATTANPGAQTTPAPSPQAAAPGQGERSASPVAGRVAAPEQTQTENFRNWYGDWQNAAQGDATNAAAAQPGNFGSPVGERGNAPIDPLQRQGSVGPDDHGRVAARQQVGDLTFTGASGPVGRDGAPARLYHGTKDDFTVFGRDHPHRKDSGWLGNGHYFTSNPVDAEAYSRTKLGDAGPNVMPAYVAVRNPFVTTPALKQKLRLASKDYIDRFTRDLQSQGYDGVASVAEDGSVELVAFEPTQIKSATGNNGEFSPSNPDIRYSRSGASESQSTAGATATEKQARTQQVADQITARWESAPEVVVAANMQDPAIPEAARLEDGVRRSQGATGSPEGFYYGGKVYLVADQLSGADDVSRVLFHEALGHFGLRSVFGKELKPVLQRVVMARRDAVAAKAKEYGLDMGNEADRLTAAEEVLAEMAQTRPESTLVQRAVAAIRSWLRANVPGFKNLRVTDAEIIRDYIAPARGFVEGKGGVRAGDVREESVFSKMPDASAGGATRPSATQNTAIRSRSEMGAGTSDSVTGGAAGDKPAFSRANSKAIDASMGTLTPAQQQAYEKVTGYQVPPTLKERAAAMKENIGVRMKQALVDQFAPIQDVSKEAYMLARMSKGADGTMEAALLYGKPFLRDGVPDVDVNEGGFAKTLASLKGEHDRFLMWVAAQRAELLKAQGKENLFSDSDISTLKTLNAGTMADGTARPQVYAKAMADLNAFNESTLRMAKESGLIDQAAYDLMKDQPYVPFYRLMEDDGGLQGPTFSAGLTNQKAWKKLKGGSQQLNADLLQNTLLNWSHLYTAAARNRAALATMDAAEGMAVAYKVPAETKGAAKVMRDGKTEYWMVEDPYLLEAISALHYAPSPLVKPLAKMKQILTWGVTVNPTFKVRNLIRDALSSVAIADLSYNPMTNLGKGWKLSASDSQVYASMLASGGVIKFGTQENTEHLRKQVAKLGGVVLDQNRALKLWGQVKSLYDVYSDFGDRTENLNRTALYDRLIKKGHTHAEASFMARDLMDFSMGGSMPVVRFLTQTVPFLNARLQGLYKLGRAAKEDPRRFAAVAGAVSMASLALMALYADDDDWKKREDWDRDAYWWFKIGGTAYRIPKPFEVGAIGTLAERTAELMFDKEMTNARFMERAGFMVAQTFAFDPVPQAIKPLLDIYSNKDSFTKRAIETQADQRLRPEDRYSERTSEVARLLGSWGLPDPVQLIKGDYAGLSPKQIDHLLRGYFSWAASAVTTTADYAMRPAMDRGDRPDLRLKDVFVAGNFMESLPTGSSRYVTQLYEQARAVEQAYASYREAIKQGDTEKAQAIKEEHGSKLRNRVAYTNATRQLAEINSQAKKIEANKMLSGEAKRERLEALEKRRVEVGERARRLTAT